MGTTQQTLQTAARNARTQSAVVECREDGREWWVMLEDGSVHAYDHASAALKAVRNHARRGNKGLTVTTVEWRNVPDGWKPPQS